MYLNGADIIWWIYNVYKADAVFTFLVYFSIISNMANMTVWSDVIRTKQV